jgi:glycerol-3-phosphate dehydrogenase
LQQGSGSSHDNESEVKDRIYDILVIGGGINGTMVARDAAGRGLSVLLVEKDDLASGTSSASSKMIHGGLRYLEHYDFALVRESLREREIMLRSARHIVQPLRLVLPNNRSSRPSWMILIGLWIYDHLVSHISLPRSAKADLKSGPFAEGLKQHLSQGFAFSDCWTDDARLVVLAARDAAQRGATIMTRTRCDKARREGQFWYASLTLQDGSACQIKARAIINAAGPWAHDVLTGVTGGMTKKNLSLIKGSHIVVPRLYGGDHAFLLQNDDGRVIFVIPFEGRYSLIGTTEVMHEEAPGPVEIDESELNYLCAAANQYFEQQLKPADVVWSFAGLRPLLDDGSVDPASITRDYMLVEDRPEDMAPLISIFGGKLTTARQLAERVVNALNSPFVDLAKSWTENGTLPGGEMDDFDAFTKNLVRDHPGFSHAFLTALARRHGTNVRKIIGRATSERGLGRHFGSTLYAAEVDWLIDEEWARCAQDVLWRRTKCGLEVSKSDAQILENYMNSKT